MLGTLTLVIIVSAFAAASGLKLPLLQIYQGASLVSEFSCNDDVADCAAKLDASIVSIVGRETANAKGPSSSANHVLPLSARSVNVYSDDMLEAALFSPSVDGPIVLQVHKQGCAKCLELDDMLAARELQPLSRSVSFLRVEVENAPRFLSGLLSRLQNSRNGGMDECTICKGDGTTACEDCKGVGYILKGSLAVFCSRCGGSKRTRCKVCGGKCIHC
jgi:hypothetical protein